MGKIDPDQSAFSYRWLRLIIGVLGTTLPFVLMFGTCFAHLTSVSDYYYTTTRDWLVGVLYFLTFFLAVYRPYPKKSKDDKAEKFEGLLDTVLALIAAAAAGLLALFPTYNATLNHTTSALCPPGIFLNFVDAKLSGTLHNIGSGVLFTVFAFMSMFVFTQTAKIDGKTREKAKGPKLVRNILYIAFGVGILACIITIGVGVILANGNQEVIDRMEIFPIESTALVLFGLSWLVKGAAFPFLNDKKGKTSLT